MSVDTRNIFFDNNNDANFRAWGLSFSQMVQACGLVLTTDTGQINWTTVTRSAQSSGAENIVGYEMYRFNDSLQATKPVFIKVEYGYLFASSTFGHSVIYVTVGSGTNGAGTLNTSMVSTRTRFVGGATSAGINHNATNITSPCYASGDGSSIRVALGVTTSAQPVTTVNGTSNISFPAFLVIERTYSSSGVITGDGVMFLTCKWPTNGNSGNLAFAPTSQMLSFNLNQPATQDLNWPVAFPGSAFNNGSTGTDISLWPVSVSSPGAHQSLGVLGIFKGDLTMAQQISATVMGAAHNYLSLAGIAGTVTNDAARGQVITAIPNGHVMMRYE